MEMEGNSKILFTDNETFRYPKELSAVPRKQIRKQGKCSYLPYNESLVDMQFMSSVHSSVCMLPVVSSIPIGDSRQITVVGRIICWFSVAATLRRRHLLSEGGTRFLHENLLVWFVLFLFVVIRASRASVCTLIISENLSCYTL